METSYFNLIVTTGLTGEQEEEDTTRNKIIKMATTQISMQYDLS